MNIIPGKPIAVATLSQDGSRSIRKIIIPIYKKQELGNRETWRSYQYKLHEPYWVVTELSFPLRNKIGTFKKMSITEKKNTVKRLINIWYLK